LVAEAEKAEKEGNKEKASEFYMFVPSSSLHVPAKLMAAGELLRFTGFPASQVCHTGYEIWNLVA
jgi:hypothetical protein